MIQDEKGRPYSEASTSGTAQTLDKNSINDIDRNINSDYPQEADEKVEASTENTPDMADEAARLARHGFGFVDLHTVSDGVCSCDEGADCGAKGKHPRPTGWQEKVITDPDEIERRRSLYANINIGSPCGPKYNLLSLDLDGPEGAASLWELEKEYGELPPTQSFKTGKGMRYLFNWPEGFESSNKVKIRPGIDIQGKGGQTVMPPSMHYSGSRYEWVKAPWEIKRGDLSPGWVDFLINFKSNSGEGGELSFDEHEPPTPPWDDPKHILGEAIKKGKPGNRHDTGVWLVCQQRDNIYQFNRTPETKESLRKDALVYQRAVNDDPDHPFPESEMLSIFDSIFDECELKGFREAVQKYGELVNSKRDEEGSGKSKRSQAMKLYDLAEEIITERFHTRDGEPYVHLNIKGSSLYLPASGPELKDILRTEYTDRYSSLLKGENIKKVIETIESQARRSGTVKDVATRIAADDDGNLWVNLADGTGRAVKITPKDPKNLKGWEVFPKSPVPFYTNSGMLPLPEPEPGSVEALRKYINLKDDDFILHCGFIVGSFNPFSPNPLEIINAGPGVGKSTITEATKRIVDPTSPYQQTQPKDVRGVIASAKNKYLLAFNNLSTIEDWFSDMMCNLITEGGYSTHTLYETLGETRFQGRRAFILNWIGNLAVRTDLVDRSIIVVPEYIEPEKLRDEREFWADFEKDLPGILGGFYTAVSASLRNWKTVELEEKSRLVGFLKFVVGGEEAMPWERGKFLKAYLDNRSEAKDSIVSSDPLVKLLIDFIELRQKWEGPAGDLHRDLGNQRMEMESSFYPMYARNRKWFPDTPIALGRKLAELSPILRPMGYELFLVRGGGKRRWCLLKTEMGDASETEQPQAA